MQSELPLSRDVLAEGIILTAKVWCLDYNSHARPRFVLTLSLLCSVALTMPGCSSGSGGAANTPVVPVIAAAISQQPVDQSVPMGLSATYSVTATGSSLQYQWAKGGAAIVGATSSSYTTPATAFSDTGASFTVTVSNSVGTISSNAAALTVTARAPMAGDLRFQQVDAASTVNGWAGSGLATGIVGRGATTYSSSLGSPLYFGSAGSCDTPPTLDGVGCTWFYTEVPLAASSGSAPLIAGYAGDFYDDFEADLQSATTSPLSVGNGFSAVSSASVITSLDLEPASDLFGISWVQLGQQNGTSASVQSVQQTAFVMEQNTVAPADLQSAATLEGAASRVITAISVNGSAVTYLAYAWQADTATVYETQVATASTAQAPTAAASLAAQGYIITAIGQADYLGNLYLVGTRVQGDTMARPFVAAQGTLAIQTMMRQGYANIGVIVNDSNQTDPATYLGER
jgi:hypothetical protein